MNGSLYGAEMYERHKPNQHTHNFTMKAKIDFFAAKKRLFSKLTVNEFIIVLKKFIVVEVIQLCFAR